MDTNQANNRQLNENEMFQEIILENIVRTFFGSFKQHNVNKIKKIFNTYFLSMNKYRNSQP